MRRLTSALRIRPGEERTAFRLLALMFVAMAGAAVGANGVESLFFSRFGPGFLPYLYVMLGPVTCAVMVGIGALVATEATRFLVRLPLILALVAVASRALLTLDIGWFYPALWLVMMVMWTSLVMGSWGLAGAVSDTRQAKRLFPLYGAGLITGAVIGGLATGPLANLLGAENLLVVWAGALVVTFVLARMVVGTRATTRRRRRPARHRVGLGRQMVEGFRDLATWPLLRWMSVSLVLFAILYFTLALLFARAATDRFPQTDQLAGFLGLFMGASNGAALLVSLLVANRLFARFGVVSMVLVLAAIYLVGFGVLAVSAAFGVLLAFRFVQMVWVNGVWATGWQALFNVVPEERRARTRTFMDGGPLQAGIVLSGVLLILADRVIGPRALYVVGVAAAALATVAMWRARRAYGGALIEALRTGNPDVFRPGEEPFGGFARDAGAYAAVERGASDPDPGVRRVSMEILADAEADSAAVLERGLADPDPEVRAAALRGLAGREERPDPDRLAPLLDDPDPEVRARAAGLLDDADDRGRRTLTAMGRDPRPEWRAAAISGWAGSGGGEVEAALGDPDPSVRRAAADALGRGRGQPSIEPLVAALGDRDPVVRDVAAAALVRVGIPAQQAVIEALSLPALEAGALTALVGLADPPSPALHAYAERQATQAVRYHKLWERLDPRRDERVALLADAVRHRALLHALRGLRAVAAGRAEAAMAIDNLSSRDGQQRANALETLEASGEPDIVRPLLAVWDAGQPRGVDTVSAIGAILGDDDPWLRACAALAAGGLSDRRLASDLLDRARSDPDPLVREALSPRGGDVETLSTLSLLERILFLRKVPLFVDLSPGDLRHIAEAASEHVYPDGEVIAEQGEAGDEMHIVVEGGIRVMVDAGEGPSRELARRTKGENVGEMALLTGESRMASLVCTGPVRTLSLDRKRFERILRERPDVGLAVMRVLSDRLRESDSRRRSPASG